MLWLNHHNFEELLDALEYYLANPNSELEADLTHLNLLDQRVWVTTICPIVTMTICTLLVWAKCFLATYGEYPGIYDLLDIPQSVFIAAQLHLHDSTFPRPLLPRSRGPPTLQNEPVALQPHPAPPTPPDHLYICPHTCLLVDTTVCHQAISPSIILSIHHVTSLSVGPSVCHATSPSVDLSVHHATSLSMNLFDLSVCHPTFPSCNQSI